MNYFCIIIFASYSQLFKYFMLMKKTLLMFALFFTALVMNAQTYYKCTGDNVNVRTGPGKNYAVAINQGFETRCQLFKGNIVRSLGSTRNGFTYVRFSNCGMTGASCYPDNGWVSSQYLRKMTKRCPACGGRGFFNRRCTDYEGAPEDHPGACLCVGRYCLHDNCDGKQHCNNCGGVGWL